METKTVETPQGGCMQIITLIVAVAVIGIALSILL
jgi:hypothetical protein